MNNVSQLSPFLQK